MIGFDGGEFRSGRLWVLGVFEWWLQATVKDRVGSNLVGSGW